MRKQSAYPSVDGPCGGTAQTGSDIFIDPDDDVEFFGCRKGHCIENTAIDKQAQLHYVALDPCGKRVVRLGDLHLENTPDALVILQGAVQPCAVIPRVPIFLAITEFLCSFGQHTGLGFAARYGLIMDSLVGIKPIVVHGQGPPVRRLLIVVLP